MPDEISAQESNTPTYLPSHQSNLIFPANLKTIDESIPVPVLWLPARASVLPKRVHLYESVRLPQAEDLADAAMLRLCPAALLHVKT